MLLYDFTSGAENSLRGKNRASFNSAICNEKEQRFYRATTVTMKMSCGRTRSFKPAETGGRRGT